MTKKTFVQFGLKNSTKFGITPVNSPNLAMPLELVVCQAEPLEELVVKLIVVGAWSHNL